MLIRPMMIGLPLGAAAGLPTTWSVTDKTDDWTLSGDLLTTQKVAANGPSTGRATTFRSNGRYYAEIKKTASTNIVRIGLANASALLSDALGGDAGGNGIGYASNGPLFYKGSSTTYSSLGVGAVLGIAVDLNARTIDWYINGSFVVSSTIIPAGNLALAYGATGSAINQAILLNAGASPFAFPIPSGFSPWG